ncbi:MAG: hypothetical protein PHH91_07645 [Desulfuromonadaceae bacterium]|nr:hypothetical protein [Desulfuromonadaceae bacterium]
MSFAISFLTKKPVGSALKKQFGLKTESAGLGYVALAIFAMNYNNHQQVA